MATDNDPRTWLERMQHDRSLADFVDAEVNRAVIELDSLRWQAEFDRHTIEKYETQLAQARAELAALRRRLHLEDPLPIVQVERF